MSAPSSPPRLNRLLLTGAAGGLGKVLRERLRPFAETLRVSDVAALGIAGCNRNANKAAALFWIIVIVQLLGYDCRCFRFPEIAIHG